MRCNYALTRKSKIEYNSTNRTAKEQSMDQRFFAESAYQIPIYGYGSGLGYLRSGLVTDQRQIMPNHSDRSSFSIDSILTHTCSRDVGSAASTPRMGIKDECGYFPRRRDHRFSPYFQLHRPSSTATSEQTGVFGKPASGKNENEGKEVAEQKSWSLEKPKRMRTIFTVEQLERMEKEFDRQQYMVGADRFFLANELGLSETQVKVWFQNRRIKWRKNILEKQHRELNERFKSNV